jgi:ATP-dependent helicase HrpB
LLGERDPLRVADSDIQLRVEWLRGAGDDGTRQGEQRRSLRGMADAWLRKLGAEKQSSDNADLARCGTLLAFAYPDRIAMHRKGQVNRFLLSNGRGARFRDAEPLAASEFLVAAHLDGEKEAVIYLAAAISRDQLQEHHADLIREQAVIAWDENEAAVLTRKQLRLGELLLDDRPLKDTNREAVQHALLGGIQSRGLDCLPWNAVSRQLQLRVGFMKALEPDDWHEYRVQAQGNHLQHWIDGNLVLEIFDFDQQQRSLEGVLALRLPAGAEGFQVREMKIKHLPDESPLANVGDHPIPENAEAIVDNESDDQP